MNKGKLLFLPLFFVSAFNILSTEAKAQCVQCSTQGRKIASQVDSRRISLGENIVREIRMSSPHLAAALAFIDKKKELLADGSATVYLMPSEITAQSGAPETPDATKDSVHSLLARLDETPSHDSADAPMVYEVTIEAERGQSAATLRIQKTADNRESSTSLLEVNLVKSKSGWRATGWQAR